MKKKEKLTKLHTITENWVISKTNATMHAKYVTIKKKVFIHNKVLMVVTAQKYVNIHIIYNIKLDGM